MYFYKKLLWALIGSFPSSLCPTGKHLGRTQGYSERNKSFIRGKRWSGGTPARKKGEGFYFDSP
jgi:hypothetical protein